MYNTNRGEITERKLLNIFVIARSPNPQQILCLARKFKHTMMEAVTVVRANILAEN